MRNILILLNICLLGFYLAGCKEGSSSDVIDAVKQQYESAKKELEPIASDVTAKTTQQTAKMLRYEYKVVTLPNNTSDISLESQLNLFGQDRWDCFSVMPTSEGTRITCRRIPYALLRYFLKLM